MFWSLSILAMVSGVRVQFQFNGHEYVRLPVLFTVSVDSNDGETMEGYVQLKFGFEEPPRLTRSVASPPFFVTSYSIIGEDGETYHENFQRRGTVPDAETNTVGLWAHPSSHFARNDFVVYPTSQTDGVLEIDPQNPAAYAVDNRLFFSTPSSDRSRWMINRVHVRLSFGEDEHHAPVDPSANFGECSIIGSDDLPIIPNHAMDDLLSLMSEFGVGHTNDHNGRITLHGLTDWHIWALPSVQIILQTDEETFMNLATLEPREYISEDRRILKLRTLRRAPYTCSLTVAILKKLVVYFDQTNNRIGFAEPIADI